MFEELIEQIRTLNDITPLKEQLLALHPYDVIKIYDELSEDDKKKLLAIFDEEALAEILSYTEADEASDILEEMSVEEAASILNEMESDDASDVMEKMNDDIASKVKENLDEDVLNDIEALSKYDDDTAGAIMNPSFLQVKVNTSVKDATKHVIASASEHEDINTIFVTDEGDHLKGIVDLRELICARMPKTVNDIMLENYQAVSSQASFDEVTKLVRDYDIKSLPVIEDGKIVGVITMDDAFDAMTQSAEEDYAKLAGLTEDEDSDESIISSFKKRIPWLGILLVLDILIAIVISRFSNIIGNPDLVVLTFFQAALLGLSGNCGTQALAVSVRRLATSEGGTLKYLLKEIIQSIGLGLILGVIAFGMVVIMLMIKNSLHIEAYQTSFIIKVGLTLAISVISAVVISNLLGAILPIIFDKIHIDPAVASGPFITTINDIVSIVIYFSVAMIFFSEYL